MADWCTTDYVIEGPKEDLERIHDAMLNHDTREDSDESWIGNVLIKLGVEWDEKTTYLKSFIEYIKEFDGDTLDFYLNEAYGLSDFETLISKAFPDIKVYWFCDESVYEQYSTNDETGKYFPTKYVVDILMDGDDWYNEYFETKPEALVYIKDVTDGLVKNDDDIEKYNAEHEKDDSYVHMNEVEIIRNEGPDVDFKQFKDAIKNMGMGDELEFRDKEGNDVRFLKTEFNGVEIVLYLHQTGEVGIIQESCMVGVDDQMECAWNEITDYGENKIYATELQR